MTNTTPTTERAQMLRDSRRLAALDAAAAGYPLAAQLMGALADATQPVDVTIPHGAFTELATDEHGPHIAVYATATDSTPIIRIRVADGPLMAREAAADGFASAAGRLHTSLRDDAIYGGAL
ncbi:hypothetical protein [Nocardiopsis sp. NRRL B-16309]|uniref:hypothetical protein n=1 Tax=Nocardiopsis sp. NRRL B-16309 TaxID=1519494 RepID=UPI0006B01A5D|nr:hypothetical protein [Nocardiopsis sp. NRRL B-16309]KOX10194.1 hypothetical protein ADL05_26340 [Nocardiopsis sp. NRRL B-16309]